MKPIIESTIFDQLPDKYIKQISRSTDTKKLNNDHRLLHIWWSTPDQRYENWTVPLIKKAHDTVVKRLEELSSQTHSPSIQTPNNQTPSNQTCSSSTQTPRSDNPNSDYMPIAPSGQELGDSVAVKEFLKHIGAFQLKHDWIKLVGGTANCGETKNDFDIIIDPINSGDLEHIARFRLFRGLPEELSRRLSFLDQKNLRGPFTNFYSLGDLVFVPKANFQLVKMAFRSAPEEIKAQAEESQELDTISISRVFYPMKPVRGALKDKPQTIPNFIQIVEDFPCFVSKKFDGNTFIFFKNGNKVRVFSDDGLERTDKFSQILDSIRELPQKSLIFLAEVELWIDDIHYPRESIRSAFSSHPEWLDFLSVNIFELLYVNGRDIHMLKAKQRVSIAQQTFSQLQSIDDKAPKPGLNLVPQYLVKDKEELEEVTEKLSYLPASEGVIVKHGDYALDGKAKVDQEIKFHKASVVHCVIYERIETKTEGVYVYRYGLPNDLDTTPASTVEVNGQELVPIGKTFSTAIKADPGDTLSIEFETLNFTKNLDDDTFKISFWIPTVLETTTSEVDSIETAISKAEEKGILQKKWIFAKDTYYDVPEQRENVPEQRENALEQFQAEDPYIEYPPHGEKMDFMRHAHFRRKSVHFDARRETIKGKWAVGWTENTQIEDAISEDIDTLEKADDICKNYTVKEGNKHLKPLKEAERIVLEEKAPEPFAWLSVNKVVPPGTPGATDDYPGVLYIIDKGKTEWGTMKPYYHEYFDSEGDIFNGRYICRQLKDRWNITDYETVWFGWYAETALPYVISKRAIEKDWMPPDGQSALPEVIRTVIPEKYHYWKKEGDEAKKLRQELVESSLITEDNLSFNDKGEITIVEQVKSAKKSLKFCLAYRSWKGQFVVRFGRKGKDWIIMFKDGNKIHEFHCARSPLEEDNVSATYEVAPSTEFFNFEGDIPPEHPINPLEEISISQLIIDKGSANIAEQSKDFWEVKFQNDKLSGSFTFIKSGGGLWIVRKETVPEDSKNETVPENSRKESVSENPRKEVANYF